MLSSCIRAIFGAEHAKNIIPISYTANGITVSGFLGNREIQKSNRTGQILFINGRSVKNEIVSSAVQQGYAGRLNIGKFPFFVLNINMKGNLVDVNVHPTKKEVRFADGLPVFETVAAAVEKTLLENQEIPDLYKKEEKEEEFTFVTPIEEKKEEYVPKAEIKPVNSEVFEFAKFINNSKGVVADKPSAFIPKKEETPVQQVKIEIKEEERLPEYRIVGIMFDTYIIVECGEDIYIIDQHAAHERLRFEALFAQTGEKSSSQIMLLPQIIKVSPSEQAILEDLIPRLEELGYEIENIGFGSFAVKATPSALEESDTEAFITSLLDESTSIRMLKTNELKRNKLMQLACKSAVKAGDKLSDADIKKLLQLIVKEQIPLSCPHGRPILIRLTSHELEVRFKRIQ